MTENQGALFEPPPAPHGGDAIEKAAAVTIEALRGGGALDASHTLKVELIMQGSRALDREFRQATVSVAAINLFKKVLDAADQLPTVQQAINDTFERLTKDLADAD